MTGHSKKKRKSQHAIVFGLSLTCLDKIHFKKYSSLSEIDWSWSWLDAKSPSSGSRDQMAPRFRDGEMRINENLMATASAFLGSLSWEVPYIYHADITQFMWAAWDAVECAWTRTHARMPNLMPDRMPEWMPENEKMPSRMPCRMSDRMSEHMPDRMSDRISEYIYIYIYIYYLYIYILYIIYNFTLSLYIYICNI